MDIAIVDNDVHFSKIFDLLIQKYLCRIFESYNVTIVTDNILFNLKQGNFDIIFLDIDLDNISGINVALFINRLRHKNLIIFISSKNELVFESLSVQPFQFIRKSNLEEDTALAFSLLSAYYKENKSVITINFHGRKTSIKVSDIIYIESDRHITNIITVDSDFSYRCTMKQLLSTINSTSFVQIQKSITVNFDFVREIDGKNNVVLNNGNIFTISRHFKNDVLIKYEEYLLS